MKQRKTKFDKRLIGTWKSDRKRTFLHFKPAVNCRPQSFRKLKALFGKLIIRWGRTKYYCKLDGPYRTDAYEVVCKDSSSVVVRFRDELTDKLVLEHIHFEDEDYYWICASGSLIEWFKRVK